MRKQVKLYNVLFPFWMLLIFPQMWLFVIPGNFIIDSVVLIVSMYALKFIQKKQYYKKTILKVFIIGMFSDIIGSAYMFSLLFFFEVGRMGDELYITLPALLISAALIYVLNYFVSFKSLGKASRIKMSVIFAVFTAPYTFLIPSSWLYGF